MTSEAAVTSVMLRHRTFTCDVRDHIAEQSRRKRERKKEGNREKSGRVPALVRSRGLTPAVGDGVIG